MVPSEGSGRIGEVRPPSPLEIAVLDAVDAVPPGEVASYGEIAAAAGTSPRVVGRVLARLGDEVPWHRVVRADGSVARHLEREQLDRLVAEGVRLRADGRGVVRPGGAQIPERTRRAR
jgi:methylated-DNA-protein-cysteine methyltransferase related protein